VPCIGKKTAERLLLELKGKLGDALNSETVSSAINASQSDILQALIALGYNEREAQLALKALPAESTVSNGIKQAI
jgi:holliday junction DNA helicase RuvA